MTWIAVAIGGSAILNYVGGRQASKEQVKGAEAGITETGRQFDLVRELLSPYVQAGAPALEQQQALLGLGGPEAEEAAIARISGSPLFQAQVQQGEEALLQRASATGGLRGGNIHAALAQFRPQMLSRAIQQQYQNLGGLTSLGQRSAAGVGAEATQTGRTVADLLGQRSAAQAGGILAAGQAFSAVPQALGTYYGLTGKVPFGGATPPPPPPLLASPTGF